ncbi:hypothetical protein [Pleomorphomonas sp. JP5]|uniref:hypothetical protein n=1 Tax=Pleomorphomonas sp. JP5 TaxID=2942998 RepID=UPI0020435787|nr:hypothetical protein [Pleomorphomonas sp. JP5]MCM5557364.1 hypothetical protein [Pleomorphomonas sp. JP5]
MKSVAEWDDSELANLVANYQRQGKVNDAYYLELLSEQARRKGAGLNFDKTFRAVLKAARDRRFLSYKQLADESGVEWVKVRYAMNKHLDDLLEFAHGKGWPLASAIVVNQQNLADGSLEASSLKGFCDAARRLGYAVTDEAVFLREQQERVFDWAAGSEET